MDLSAVRIFIATHSSVLDLVSAVRRLVSDVHLPLVMCKPHCGRSAKTQLIVDLVAIIAERVVDRDRMVASRSVFIDTLFLVKELIEFVLGNFGLPCRHGEKV